MQRTEYPKEGVGPVAVQPVDSSSNQFQYFMRLMQLFPTIHPAYIHSVLTACNNDFMRTIDSLLRSRHHPSMPTGVFPRKLSPPPPPPPPPLHFYQKMPAVRFLPRYPVLKLNGGFPHPHQHPHQHPMYRQLGNIGRFQLPVLPKPPRNLPTFGLVHKLVDDVPVVKVEKKGTKTPQKKPTKSPLTTQLFCCRYDFVVI